MKVRGQLAGIDCGVSFSHLAGEVWESNLSHWHWQQVLLPDKPITSQPMKSEIEMKFYL